MLPPVLELTVKLLISAELVGGGMNFNSNAAAGLISLMGIVLLGNCVRPQAPEVGAPTQAALTLNGSKIMISEGNTPVRSSAVGTVVVVVDAVRWR